MISLPTLFSNSRTMVLAATMAVSLPLLASTATAADLNLSPVLSIEDSVLLAQSDTTANDGMYAGSESQVSKDKSFFSGNRIHQYLGLGSLVFAAAAAAAGPETEGGVQPSASKKNLHRALGMTAAALGGAAIANGFYVHGDDFNLDNGWLDPDNLHVLLTVVGTLGYVAAVATKGKGGHAAAGAGGAALMGLGIVLEW